jgi:acyl carrier protein
VTGLREQLDGLSDGRQRAVVSDFVRERALRSLGLDPARALDPRTPLAELGLDSLLAVELRNQLGTALGTTLPATTLFDYPTLETLTGYLLADVLELQAGAETAKPSALGAIEELSDEEVERQLAARAGARR